MKTSTKQIFADQPRLGGLAVESGCAFGYAGRFADSGDVPMHRHEGSELILIEKGRCAIDVEDHDTLLACAGTLCVIPFAARHNQRHFESTHTSFVTFRADHSFFDDSARAVQVGVDSLLAQWVAQINMLHAQGGSCHAYAGAILSVALQWVMQSERGSGDARSYHPALSKAIAYLEQRRYDPVSMQQLTDVSCVSEGYLTALFKRHLAVGPIHYQQRLRMERAKQLLAMPYLSVSQVAHEVGYGDANYFGRIFRKHTGVSPRGYRRGLHGTLT
jgi:AraC-like DNA-binding protein